MDIQGTDRLGPLKLPTAPLRTEGVEAEQTVQVAAPSTIATDATQVVGAGEASTYSLETGPQESYRAFLADDPQALEQLQTLALSGKLTSEVRDALNQLSRQPLAAGINRTELLRTAVQNLADPTTIRQGDRDTCAAAAVQVMLAKQDPAEYLKLVAGLASPEGKATLKDGSIIERDKNWNSDPTRSVLDNLIQPSFMQKATDGQYDSLTDTRTTPTGTGKGLLAAEQDKLASAVLGRGIQSVFGNGPDVIDAVTKATDSGKPVSAIIKVTDPETGKVSGHSVTVESIKDGMVSVVDSNGGRRTMSLEEFKAQLQSVGLPKEFITPTLQAATIAPADGGLLAGRRRFRLRGPRGLRRVFRAAFKPFTMAHKLAQKARKAVTKAWKKVWKKIKKWMPIIMMILAFIPGVNLIVLAYQAYQVAQAIKTGNWAAVAAAAANFIPGAGPMISKAITVYQGYKNGGVKGALLATAASFGGSTGQTVAAAVNTVDAIRKKDYAAALGGLAAMGGATGKEEFKTAAKVVSGLAAIDAARKGDLSGAVAGLAGTGLVSDSETLKKVQSGVKAYEAARNGDYAAAIQGLKGTGLVDNSTLDKIEGAAGVAAAVKKGDVSGALQNLKGTGLVEDSTLDKMSKFAAIAEAAHKKDIAGAVQGLKESGFVNAETMRPIAAAAKIAEAAQKKDATGVIEGFKEAGAIDSKQANKAVAAVKAAEAAKAGDQATAVKEAAKLGLMDQGTAGRIADGIDAAKALKTGNLQPAADVLKKEGVLDVDQLKADAKSFARENQTLTNVAGAAYLANVARKEGLEAAVSKLEKKGPTSTTEKVRAAVNAVEQARTGDVAQALESLKAAGLPKFQGLDTVQGAFAATQAAQKGDVDGAFKALKKAGIGGEGIEQVQNVYGAAKAAQGGDLTGALEALKKTGIETDAKTIDQLKVAIGMVNEARQGNVPAALDSLKRTGLIQDTAILDQLRNGASLAEAAKQGNVGAALENLKANYLKDSPAVDKLIALNRAIEANKAGQDDVAKQLLKEAGLIDLDKTKGKARDLFKPDARTAVG